MLAIPRKEATKVDWKAAHAAYQKKSKVEEESSMDLLGTDWDALNSLREKAVSAHDPKLTCSYYTKLAEVGNHLPVHQNEMKVKFIWRDSLTKKKSSSFELNFERSCVLFLLGSHYSLKGVEAFSPKDGGALDASLAHFEMAAGAFAQLQQVASTWFAEAPSTDLSAAALEAFKDLMLAQAQEAAYRRESLAAGTSTGDLAQLAAQAAELYQASLDLMLKSSAFKKSKAMMTMVQAKCCYFGSLAHHHAAPLDAQAEKYGTEISRLELALSLAQEAKASVKADKPLEEEIEAHIRYVESRLKSANKDNDTIYMEAITPKEQLPALGRVLKVQPNDLTELFGASSPEGLFPKRAPNTTPVTENEGKRQPFTRESSIVIIGGGPAGIHMAAVLKKKGYANIVVLEKEERFGGKTSTEFLPETGDLPHEMGTCYLHSGYQRIKGYMDQYLGEGYYIRPGFPEFKDEAHVISVDADMLRKGHDSGELGKPRTPSDWLYKESEEREVAKSCWRCIPNKLQLFTFLDSIIRYNALHKKLFGEYEYGLPPRPTKEFFNAELDMTFEEFLKKHDLLNILTISSLGSGSYGFPYDVPAFYGLAFMSPTLTSSFVQSKLKDEGLLWVTKDGYSKLWETLVEKESVEVRTGCEVTSVNRHLDDPSAKVEVQYNQNGENHTLEADFIFWASPQKSTKHLFTDLLPQENEIFSSLRSVGLVTTLYTSDARKTWKKDGTTVEDYNEAPLTFYPESLDRKKPNGLLYAERDNYKAHRPAEKPTGRFAMGYQYYPTYDPKCLESSARDLISFVKDHGVQNPNILKQKNYDYFPHFGNGDLSMGRPWQILDLQGHHKTWYLGSSVWYESAEDIVNYNEMMLRLFLDIDMTEEVKSVITYS